MKKQARAQKSRKNQGFAQNTQEPKEASESQNKPGKCKQINRRGHTKNVATSKVASLFIFPGLFSNLRHHNTDLPKTHRNENKPADFKIAGPNFNKSIGRGQGFQDLVLRLSWLIFKKLSWLRFKLNRSLGSRA